VDPPRTISQPPEPAGVTLAYEGDPLPAKASTERPRVAIVTGRSTGSSAELAQLLRTRLLIIAVVGAVVNAIDRTVSVATTWTDVVADPIGIWVARPNHITASAIVVVYTLVAFVLRARRDLTLDRLRLIEGVLFALLMANCVSYTLGLSKVHIPDHIPRSTTLANAELIMWFGCIVVYGVLIPNTARRCLTVVGVMVVMAAACMIGTWLYYGAPPQRLIGWTTNLILWMGLVFVITVTGAHWSDQLRRQAQEARRLGQYVLRRQLGAGGMGEVYLAEHRLLRRPAAIKLIRPERAGDAKDLLRFEREVQTTATLTHPNTVQVFDYGHAEDGTFYYVMEYLPGLTLDQLVQQHGPLPPARTVHFLRQVSAALREAHAVGLIHRDIKPGNVMVCERGGVPDVAKLLDFGLVLPLGDVTADDKLTQEGAIAGTPTYMSPEQAGGQELPDARSDIYSVGALAYYLLTGQPPFAGRSSVKTLAAHLYEAPEPLTRHRPDVPADVEAVVLRCLAKHPADRYPNAGNLEAALVNCANANPWTAEQAAAWWQSQNGPAGPPGAPPLNNVPGQTTH
jgi:serine/threonine-protein kinase